MSSVLTKNLVGPSAWKGKDLQGRTDWIYKVPPSALEELESALACALSSGRAVEQIRKEDFPLPTFAAELAAIATELEHGRG
ncbi:MAG: TauD/TfdA family dioxygenase, partial [Vicinamibacterales bacterium]